MFIDAINKCKNFIIDNRLLIKLTAASYIQSALTFITGLVNIKFLSPADIGHYSGTLLWKDFALHCNSGENESLRKLLPKAEFAGQQQDYFNRAFSLAVLTIIFYTALAIALNFLSHADNKVDLTHLAVFLVFIIEYVQYSFQATLMGTNRFSLISKFILLTSVINLSSVIFVYLYGFNGFLAGRVLYAFISLIIMIYLAGIRPTDFVLKGYWEILKIGLPMQATVIGTLLNLNAGRIYLTFKGDNLNLGLLAFCLYFTVPFAQIVINISGLSFFKYSAVNDLNLKRNWMGEKSSWLLILVGTLISTSMVGLLIKFIFSNYSQIILSTQLLILATITLMLYSDKVSFILANNGGVSLTLFNIAGSTIFFIAAFALNKLGLEPLLAISFSSLISAQILGLFFLLWLKSRGRKRAELVLSAAIKDWLGVFAPILFSAIVLFLCDKYI